MPDLATAIDLAVEAHRGQVDKLGVDYIQHPLAVMVLVGSERQKIVAVLHDVVEDTDVTLEDIRAAGFDPATVDCVDAITKRRNEPLEESMGRIMAEPTGDARQVKLADISHNANPARQAALDEVTRARLRRKYTRSAALLGTSLDEVLASFAGSPFR